MNEQMPNRNERQPSQSRIPAADAAAEPKTEELTQEQLKGVAGGALVDYFRSKN